MTRRRLGMKSRTGRRPDCGQVLVESALALPLVLLMAGGAVQLGLTVYASALARYAAFEGMRAASLNPGAYSDRTVRERAEEIIAGAPGLDVAWARLELKGTRVAAAPAVARVALKVPRLMPFGSGTLHVVTASCAMPLEPWW